MNDRTVIRPGGRRPKPNQQGDRRVIRPDSGAQRQQSPRPQPGPGSYQTPPPQPTPAPAQYSQGEAVSYSDNPLLGLVSPLIGLVSKVSNAKESVDMEQLRGHATEQMNYFHSVGFNIGTDAGLVNKASYALCCLLDDIVLNTPWGSESSWSTSSMLVQYHQEAWGGENFFIYLNELTQNPNMNYHVLELYYVVLNMGFQGKYRQSNNGVNELSVIINELYSLLDRFKGSSNEALSHHWQGVGDSRHSLLSVVPQWVIWSVCAGISLVVFITLNVLLGARAEPVYASIAEFSSDQAIEVRPGNLANLGNIQPTQEPEPDLIIQQSNYFQLLSDTLSQELQRGQVEIEKTNDGTLVRLVSNNLFRSGSDTLAPNFLPVLEKIGNALAPHRVQVGVTGHTDNIPINTIRFSNNWALSSARAKTVLNILKPYLNSNSRILASGMAETMPLAPNDSDFNRAKNRRVEIIVLD